MDAAESIAARIVSSLGGRGVFAVELLVRGDEVYFADVRARPDDSGLVTLRSQRLSEFELHARAILGLPLDTIMISPGAAQISYAHADVTGLTDLHAQGHADLPDVLAEALAVPESDVRLFGRPDETDGRRRLGMALATAPDVTAALDRVRRVSSALQQALAGPVSEPDPDDRAARPTMAPFLGALAIVAVVVVGVWLFHLFRGDELTAEQQIARAAVGQNDALQREDYADYRSFTCPAEQSTEQAVLDAPPRLGGPARRPLRRRGDRRAGRGRPRHGHRDLSLREGAGRQNSSSDDVCPRRRGLDGLFDRHRLGVEDSAP